MKRHIILLIAACFICFGSLTGCDRRAQKSEIQPSGKTVKIGVIGPFSGPNKHLGENSLFGIKTALKIQPYLLNGDKPELVIADDKNEPEQTKAALKKLVEVDRVTAVLLLSESKSALAIENLANSVKTPILCTVASHPEVTNSDYVTQLMFDDVTQATLAALFLMDELLIDNAAVFKNPENPHSSILADEFTQRFNSIGGTSQLVNVLDKTVDYSKILGQLEKNNINFLYMPLDEEDVVKLGKTLGEMDWEPTIMVSDGVLGQLLLRFADDVGLLEGVISMEAAINIEPTTDYGKTVKEVFRNSYDIKGTTLVALGCEGTSILLSAMNRCSDSSDKACINKRLRNTRNFSGIYGKIQIHKNGKVERPVFINTIEDGKLNVIVKVY